MVAAEDVEDEADSGEAASEDELEEDELEDEEDEFESGDGAAGAFGPMAEEGDTVCGGACPRVIFPRLSPAKTTPKTAIWKRLIVVFTLVTGNVQQTKLPAIHCSQRWMPMWLVR